MISKIVAYLTLPLALFAADPNVGALAGYGYVISDTLHITDTALLYERDGFCGLHCMKKAPCCPTRQPHTLWGDGFGDSVRQASRRNIPRFHGLTGGALLGYDYMVNPNVFFVWGGGYSHSTLHFRRAGGHGEITSAHFGMSGSFCTEMLAIETSLLGNQHWLFARRHVIGDPDGSHTAQSLLAHLGLGLYFRVRGLELSPFGEAEYDLIHERSYREKNGYHIEERTPTFLRAQSGLRFNYPVCVIFGTFIPSLKLAWVRLQPLSGTRVSTSTFEVPTSKYTFDGVTPGASLSFVILDAWDITANYEGEYMFHRNLQRVDLAVACQF